MKFLPQILAVIGSVLAALVAPSIGLMANARWPARSFTPMAVVVSVLGLTVLLLGIVIKDKKIEKGRPKNKTNLATRFLPHILIVIGMLLGLVGMSVGLMANTGCSPRMFNFPAGVVSVLGATVLLLGINEKEWKR